MRSARSAAPKRGALAGMHTCRTAQTKLLHWASAGPSSGRPQTSYMLWLVNGDNALTWVPAIHVLAVVQCIALPVRGECSARHQCQQEGAWLLAYALAVLWSIAYQKRGLLPVAMSQWKHFLGYLEDETPESLGPTSRMIFKWPSLPAQQASCAQL